MKNPFTFDENNQRKADRLQNSLKTAFDDIEDFRLWLGDLLIEDDKATGTTECTCVKDNAEQLYRILHGAGASVALFGQAIEGYIQLIRNHDAPAPPVEEVRVSAELGKKIKDGTATVSEIVSALPINLDDDGVGPNGVH